MMSYGRRTWISSHKKLVRIEVEPYAPNKQLSVINNRGGTPKNHYPSDDGGVYVVMISLSDAEKLKDEFKWIKKYS